MRRTQTLGLVMAATSLAGLAAFSPASSGATTAFTWTQKAVAESSSFTEPSISIDKDGRIVVCSPGGIGNQYWSSHDGGKTFVHAETGGDAGGGDCELQFLPDGTLVSSDLAITTSYIHISKDGGRTFTRAQDSGQEQDRQWFAHYRDEEVYNVYHGIAEEYEFVVTSTDGGETWGVPELVNHPAQAAGTPALIAKPGDVPSFVDQGYNTFSGPMLVDQETKDKYVLYSMSDVQSNATSVAGFGPTRGIVVAHKGPEDALWDNRYAVVSPSQGPLGGDVNGAIFPWGTIDAAGNVYVFFNSSKGGFFHTYYTYSTDKAQSWSEPIRIDGNPDAEGATVYATGMGGAAGVIDVAWLESDNATSPDDPLGEWHVDFAQIRNAASAAPSIELSRITDHVMHKGAICQKGILCVLPGDLGGDRSLGDFFELALGPDGMAQLAWTDNGRADEPRQVFWAKQLTGASAYSTSAATPVQPKPTQPKPTQPKPGQPKPVPPAAPLPVTGASDAAPRVALALLALAGAALAVGGRRSEGHGTAV